LFQRTQSGRFAHLDHSYRVFAQPYVTSIDRVTKRPMRAALHPVPTARLANHFRRPFSTIRHRRELDLRLRNYIANSECNIFRNLPGAERAFEFIGGDEDAHFQRFKSSSRAKSRDPDAVP